MMKKAAVYLVGVLAVISLAACTPTPEKQDKNTQVMETAPTGGASDKVPDPNVEPVDIISVYYQNEEKTGLNKEMDSVEKLDAQALLDKLVEYGQFSEGIRVISFDKVEKVGTLDLSELPQLDEQDMALAVVSVGNTFIENFELDELKLKVGGTDFESITYEKNYKEFK